MASILNKSTHPVHVKKVSLKTWKLRDEIEHLIANRVNDSEESPNIEDIKEYFSYDAGDAEEEPQVIIDDPNSFKREVPTDKAAGGQMILSDINMENVLIFSEVSYTPGMNIGITFDIPRSFILTARVDNCINLARKSRIISNNKFHYRLNCAFEYKYESQRENLRKFLKSVEPDIPPGPANIKSAKVKNPDDDDDFSDLGI